jgi:hypothetical protein
MDNTRFQKQRGLIPVSVTLLGIFLHAFFILGTMYFVIPTILSYFNRETVVNAIFLSVGYLLWMTALIWSVPLIAGATFVNAFPEIRITQKGIECRVYKLFRNTIEWHELVEIIDLPRNFKAIVIKRRGFNLVNGLYSNQIYGHIVKLKYPVLLISSDLENGEAFLNYIKTMLKVSN